MLVRASDRSTSHLICSHDVAAIPSAHIMQLYQRMNRDILNYMHLHDSDNLTIY
jgi:hypothetical protein